MLGGQRRAAWSVRMLESAWGWAHRRVLAIFATGAVAGDGEWRILRRHVPRPGRLATTAAAGWLLASIVATVPVALLGDAIDAALGGGVAGFTGVLLIIGLVGGATGGAFEALALRSRIHHLG